MSEYTDLYALMRDQLRSRRLAKGLSFAKLSEQIHTPAGTLASWEAGRRQPPMPEFIRWCAALDLAPRLAPVGMTADVDPLAFAMMFSALERAHEYGRQILNSGGPVALAAARIQQPEQVPGQLSLEDLDLLVPAVSE